MRNFNKLANLHNMFFKRAEGALPKQFQGLEGFSPFKGRPKVGPGRPLYRPAPGPGGALKGMPSPSKPPEVFPTKSSVTPGANDVDPRYTPGMSAHGKHMDDIASMTPEGRERKLRQSIQNNGNTRSIYDTFKGFDQGVGLHAPVGPNNIETEQLRGLPWKATQPTGSPAGMANNKLGGPLGVASQGPPQAKPLSDYDKYRQTRPGR